MHFRCVFTLLQWCVLVGLDWAKPMIFLSLHVTCSCICTFFYHYFDIDIVGAFSLCFFLSLFLLLVALWHQNENPLRPRTLFVMGHPLLLTPLLLTYGSVMIKPERTFQRTFLNEAFIRNAKSFYQIFPILTFPLSSTVGVRSHYVASRSPVPPWSYSSFTLTCTDLILLYLILSLAFEVRAL